MKDFLGPLKYVNAPWRYIGVILSPKGSTEKLRVIENDSRVDAGLTRKSLLTSSDDWASGNTHLWTYVGPKDELFGLDEYQQGLPGYDHGYLPILQVKYKAEGTTYEEEFLTHRLIPEYRSADATPHFVQRRAGVPKSQRSTTPVFEQIVTPLQSGHTSSLL